MPKKIVHSTSAYYQLPPELRSLVKESVACLGEVIERELGTKAYDRIEHIRKVMATLRHEGGKEEEKKRAGKALSDTYKILEKLNAKERLDFATSYTLMLELMNVCENAYRTFRLRRESPSHDVIQFKMEAITYVLTAHPTEARATQNIAIFHQIQSFLVSALEQRGRLDRDRLKSLLEIAWRVPIVRSRKPKVEDEALHIYSVALRKENLDALLSTGATTVPVYLRSWVGGDKDGHPGVDEHSLANSLSISRLFLYRYARAQLEDLGGLLELFSEKKWQKSLLTLKQALSSVREMETGDGGRIRKLRKLVHGFKKQYEKEFGPPPLPLQRMRQLLHVFPGLVIPLELREDSGLLVKNLANTHGKRKKTIAIERMLRKVEQLSRGGDPRWYAQGFIVSMTEKLLHLELAAKLVQETFGDLKLPIVPLFEQKGALNGSVEFIEAFVKHPKFKKAIATTWKGRVEVMLGYSDSSKEAGVLPSRLEVSSTMRKLDEVCKRLKVKPIYFHGSGGSVDRGGGPVEDQLSSLSPGALHLYTATIQGEMVERNFASPEIAQSQLLKIAETSERLLKGKKAALPSHELKLFSSYVEERYRATVASPVFLAGVEHATPYPFLSLLKIGSRPTKRAGVLSVSGLRAIPWVLCWTQTRVLFPTWWGVGSAWERLSKKDQKGLTRDYEENSVFRSYLHVLGFTLAKIELPVFQFYIAQSSLSPRAKKEYLESFETELAKVRRFYQAVTGHRNSLWFRPWLGESIELRSSMIHPLNLLQILAEKSKDQALLRVSVTGIASGMLTTG